MEEQSKKKIGLELKMIMIWNRGKPLSKLQQKQNESSLKVVVVILEKVVAEGNKIRCKEEVTRF